MPFIGSRLRARERPEQFDSHNVKWDLDDVELYIIYSTQLLLLVASIWRRLDVITRVFIRLVENV